MLILSKILIYVYILLPLHYNITYSYYLFTISFTYITLCYNTSICLIIVEVRNVELVISPVLIMLVLRFRYIHKYITKLAQ